MAMGRDGQAEGVAVGRGLHDARRADIAACAGAILMTTDWPICSVELCASRRAMRSVDPPAANGTTMVMVRFGKSSARAAPAAASSEAAMAVAQQRTSLHDQIVVLPNGVAKAAGCYHRPAPLRLDCSM